MGSKHFAAWHVEVSQFDKVLKILRNFGHLITKLKFESDRGGNKSKTEEIGRHIDKYGSNSLREIIVLNDRINAIGQFRNVFNKFERKTCKSLEYFQWWAQVLITVTNLTFHEYYYLNLVYLNLPVMFVDNNYLHLNNLLRLNPQLQSFQISNLVNVEFLCGVNELLPKLETLSVASLPSDFFEKDRAKLFALKMWNILVYFSIMEVRMKWLKKISFRFR